MSSTDPTQHFFKNRDGLQLSVWEFPGDGPVLTLGHCTGTCARCLDPLIAALEGRYHIYAIDCRGHGASEMPPPDACDMTSSGHDLLDMIDHFDLGEGLLGMGHSGGGAHIIAALLERPQAYRRVVLVDPIVMPPPLIGGGAALAEGARRRRNEFESLEIARERFISKPPKSLWHSAAVDAYLQFGMHATDKGTVDLNLHGEDEARFYDQGGTPGAFERLGEIATPTLLLSGTESYFIPVINMQHEGLQDAQTHIMEGGSHFVPLEQPEEVARLMKDFLERA